MPLDKHNSRTARARDFISSLINIVRPDMCLFTNHSCYSVCIRVLPLYFDLLTTAEVTICGRHIMASVQDIKIAEALLILCLAYYVMKQVRHC